MTFKPVLGIDPTLIANYYDPYSHTMTFTLPNDPMVSYSETEVSEKLILANENKAELIVPSDDENHADSFAIDEDFF